jgi:DNA-binding SARP family transcriptional activator/predicted ATPase
MYVLRLLGTLALEGSSGPLASRVVPRRRLALLALLGSGGSGGLSRDKLVGLLWPERPDPAARHLLADAVYRVRKALREDVIRSDGETLRLNPAVIQVDVLEFTAALSHDDLEGAVGCYRGPFLDGFHLPGAPREFERWVDTERSRLELEFEKALETLAERAEAGGNLKGAVEWWRRLLESDPINSRVALRLMHALAGAGDRANAIQLARDHERTLREELGVEPPAEVIALADRLRTAPESLEPETRLEPELTARELPFDVRRARPPAEPMPIPFVSREEELETLGRFMEDALAGRGRVGFIAGESGTGKTALAEEFCQRAMEARADLVVATGNGNAYTGTGDPYLLFREILGMLTGDVEARWAVGSISPDHARRLWNTLPTTAGALLKEGSDLFGPFISVGALRDRASVYGVERSDQDGLDEIVESRGASSDSPPNQAALFSQYVRVLGAVASRRPLLIVLDDLQWADTGSIDLLFQLGRELHGSRILLLGLYRPSEVKLGREDKRHPLAPVINELVRTYGEIEVPLAEEEDSAFVDAIVDALPNNLDGAFRETLFRHTRGHALFTVELLHGMQGQGMLVLDEEGRWTLGTEVDWRALPARVEAVVGERIHRLPRRLEQILTLASVEGEVFALETVAELQDSSVKELLPLVADELERRHHLVRANGLLQVGADILSQYRFRHSLFQRYLYDRLDPVQRAHLHAQMGKALERVYGDRTPEVALALARHFREARLTDKAIAYLHEAGEQAKRASAYPEAVTHFRQAIELLRTLPESPDRDRIELREQKALGSVYHGLEGHGVPEVASALERASELAEKLDDRVQRFWILVGLYGIRHLQARHHAGHETLRECLALAEEEGDAGLLALSHHWLGVNASNRGRQTEALSHFDQFRALYDPVSHRALLSDWMANDPDLASDVERGLVMWIVGYPDRATERIEGAVRLARENGDPVSLYFALLCEAILRVYLRDAEALSRLSEALHRVATEYGLSQVATLATLYRGWCLSQEDDLQGGAALMEESLTELEVQQWPAWQPFYAALLADVYRRDGRADIGLELVEDGLTTIDGTEERIHEPEQHRIRGELLLALESPDLTEAEAAFRRAIAVARAQKTKSYELRAVTSLARLLGDHGRTEEAHQELVKVYEWFTEGFDTPDLREASGLLDELSR